MILPGMKRVVRKTASEIVQVRGINYTDQISDGDLAESHNITAKRYPYITTKNGVSRYGTLTGVSSIGSWEKLVAVKGTQLLWDGTVVGNVTAGEKQFAVVNTKLVVFPDKKEVDLVTKTMRSMESTLTIPNCGGTLYRDGLISTVPAQYEFNKFFQKGDSLLLSIDRDIEDLPVVVSDVGKNGIFFNGSPIDITKVGEIVGSLGNKSDFEDVILKLVKSVPDLDYICESENRLWGCCNADKTIYASALGIPSSFNAFEGVATDSYAVGVGTDGDFTGCSKLDNSVLFFKENYLHKVMGSFPAEYQIYTTVIDGLKAGCHKSMKVNKEILYYVGNLGVYAYSGGVPSLISAKLDRMPIENARAGFMDDIYYLAFHATDGDHIYSYDTMRRIWLKHDDTTVLDFATLGNVLYMLQSDGKIYSIDNGSPDQTVEWVARFTPMYETIQGRKIYSKILIRLELPKGSWVKALIRTDGKAWKEAGKVYGGVGDVIPMSIAVNRCDKFELKLEGKGQCTVMSILREYRIGSDK